MANLTVYANQPATKGKVVLHTTIGPLDVELWSKEAPLACRNFVQLCMEGYYDGCIFHRVIKDFMAQTGDPTGTGTGGESVYEEGGPEGAGPKGMFKDEFNGRLRFIHRGLVGMASHGPNTNGSQFFITLSNCASPDEKRTLTLTLALALALALTLALAPAPALAVAPAVAPALTLALSLTRRVAR